MDHRHVQQHSIVDRYLMRRLPPDVREEFEEHYFECDQCLEQLEAAEDFRQGLQLVAAEEGAATADKPPLRRLGTVAWFTSGWRAAALAGAFVVLLVFAVALSIREIRGGRLDQANIASAEAQQTIEELQRERRQVEQALTDERRRFEAEIQSERQGRGRLTDELNRLRRPQVNTPIFDLKAVRGAESISSEPENRVKVSPTSDWMVLSLGLEMGLPYKSYRVTIRASDNRLIWSQRGLRPNPYDELTISFPSDFFSLGDYLLKLEGLNDAGEFVAVGHYPFRILKK